MTQSTSREKSRSAEIGLMQTAMITELFRYFLNCPICRSEADFTIILQNSVLQCNLCKAKFELNDYKDVQLVALPSALVHEKMIPTLESMKDRPYPLQFWHTFDLEQSLNQH